MARAAAAQTTAGQKDKITGRGRELASDPREGIKKGAMWHRCSRRP